MEILKDHKNLINTVIQRVCTGRDTVYRQDFVCSVQAEMYTDGWCVQSTDEDMFRQECEQVRMCKDRDNVYKQGQCAEAGMMCTYKQCI